MGAAAAKHVAATLSPTIIAKKIATLIEAKGRH